MDEEKTFMGLDLSLQDTGVAVMKGNEMQTFDIMTKPDQFEHSLLRVNAIANKVMGYIEQFKPNMIVMEDYFVGKNPRPIINLIELGSIVRYKILTSGGSFFTVTPQSLKKFCHGKGAGGKELVLKGVYKKWNLDVNNNNLADAIVLAYISKALYNELNKIPQDLLGYEKEVVTNVTTNRKLISRI